MIDAMTCAQYRNLIHALIDGELDAGHAAEVEAHVSTCADCARELEALRAMRAAMADAGLKERAPAHLRARIEAALPPPRRPTRTLASRLASWRDFLGGLTVGTALSGAVAAMLVIAVFHGDATQRVNEEVVAAHVRSLQAGHLTDVQTSDQHTVKPWFNGKLDLAPPVVDLTAQGFTLIGGRLDYIDGEEAASIVYRRRNHVINLFVTRHAGAEGGGAKTETKSETVHGFNVRSWTQNGLDFRAVSDINAGELDEFGQKFMTALESPPARS
jgi:mycothiol system anti-sigma-R factor